MIGLKGGRKKPELLMAMKTGNLSRNYLYRIATTTRDGRRRRLLGLRITTAIASVLVD
jgi:hypothetical protein